jgi:hypothetical protein
MNEDVDPRLDTAISKLGPDRGKIYYHVSTEVFNLQLLWSVYFALFRQNQERLDVWNSLSGSTAYWIERTMFESIALSICRLTDPVGEGKDTNLSLRRLGSIVSSEHEFDLSDFLKFAVDAADPIRKWRNKILAHADHDTKIGVAKIKNINIETLKKAISAIAVALKKFAEIEMEMEIATIPVRTAVNDEVKFLSAIYLGSLALDKREKQVKSLFQAGKWQEAKVFGELPDWLTFRPDHNPLE